MQSRTCIRMVIVLSALALGPSLAGAGDGGQDLFGVQWEPREVGGVAAVQGYVENHSQMRVGDVRLRIDSLDDHGTVIGECFGWVIGDVPSGGRAYFLVRVIIPGAAYHISVQSYDAIAPEGPARERP